MPEYDDREYADVCTMCIHKFRPLFRCKECGHSICSHVGFGLSQGETCRNCLPKAKKEKS